MKKVLSLFVALVLALSFAIPSFAVEVKPATITYREIKVLLDGRQINPTDVNGTSTEPFIMNDSTFLPVRAIAGALGLNVSWDNETSTVYLNSGAIPSFSPGTPTTSNSKKNVSITYRNIKIVIDGRVINPTDVSGNTVEPFILNGTTYLPVRAVSDALGLGVDWNNANNTVILNTSSEKPPVSGNEYAEFVKGYEKAVFSKFNSPASENGLGGTKIYFECTLNDIEFINSGDIHPMIGYVTDTTGNNWVIIMHTVPLVNGDYFDSIIGKKILLRAEYGGYSSVAHMPSASLDALINLETGELKPGILRAGDPIYDAIFFANDFPHSAAEVKNLLIEWGHSPQDADYGIAHCGINWKNQALLRLNHIARGTNTGVTPGSVRDSLAFFQFTCEEIEYAIENCDIDWCLRAFEEATFLYNFSSYNTETLIFNKLIDKGFTQSQASSGVSTFNTHFFHSVFSYVHYLYYNDYFTTYTCDSCSTTYSTNLSWCPLCGGEISAYAEYPYTKAETIQILLNTGFSSSEITSGLKNFGDTFFYSPSD